MKVYLIRHADAVTLGEQNITDDAERPLTVEGQQQARSLAAAFRERKITFDSILVSPLLRARQTADEMLSQWGDVVPPQMHCEELAPGIKAKRLARFLRKVGGDSIALVGHQPDLGEFTAWLIGSRKAQIEVAKGGIACVECHPEPDKGAGTLTCLISPEWFGGDNTT